MAFSPALSIKAMYSARIIPATSKASKMASTRSRPFWFIRLVLQYVVKKQVCENCEHDGKDGHDCQRHVQKPVVDGVQNNRGRLHGIDDDRQNHGKKNQRKKYFTHSRVDRDS